MAFLGRYQNEDFKKKIVILLTQQQYISAKLLREERDKVSQQAVNYFNSALYKKVDRQTDLGN